MSEEKHMLSITQAAPSKLLELADRIDTNKRGWLPISGHVVNVTFDLDEADAISAALRAFAAQPLAAQPQGVLQSSAETAQPAANREKIYGILYEQLDLSAEVIVELAECGNLGDVTDAILTAFATQHSTQEK